jgi:demethoxyubiquinone hydroxylase (CLK1/Coq7/Cat5 family)
MLKRARYLKNTFGFKNEQLKYAAYLLVTYAIEVRADALYPMYQKVLRSAESKVTVRTIIAEEENHLKEMMAQLKAFMSDWESVTKAVVELEKALFEQWTQALEGSLAA